MQQIIPQTKPDRQHIDDIGYDWLINGNNFWPIIPKQLVIL